LPAPAAPPAHLPACPNKAGKASLFLPPEQAPTCSNGAIDFLHARAVTRLIPLLLVLLCLATPAFARQDAAPVRAEVGRFLATQTRSLSGEVSIQVGEFSADNQLAPCLQLEAFLPPNGRAWGRISVGVRCLAPVSWSAWVPADVRVKGPYVVTNGPLAAGQIVSPGDLRVESGELTAMAADVITDPTQAIGQAARISLGAGRPLTASHLRQQPAVMQGQPVKVVSGGAGFQVANDGVALSSAANGQAAQVRLSNGQVVRGIARSGGVVEITLP
jgi:flagella basal body P-ring formation protein FlgA